MMLIPRRNFDIFDDLFNEPFFQSHESKVMKTDIKEHEDKYELIIDLPGFNKDDIKMHIENGYIVINAKTDSENEDKDKEGKYVRKERYYGECSRSYYVGDLVTESDIKATFRNGTLNIEIPKKNEEIKQEEKKYIEIGE